jgi:phosphohistidine swiveling domain-containing protein
MAFDPARVYFAHDEAVWEPAPTQSSAHSPPNRRAVGLNDKTQMQGRARMDEITWEPPGKGPWEVEATHYSRPLSRFTQDAFRHGFVKGFSEGTANYGLLLDHMEPAVVNDFLYQQPVAVGAPKGAMGPPPAPVLWLLSRLHPALRARTKANVRAVRGKRWRQEIRTWDDVDRPSIVARHREIQAVDVEALSEGELAAHVIRCRDHVEDAVYMHHKYTITSTFVTGDFLAGAAAWTGVPAGELLTLLRGTSPISKGFAAEELDRAAKAIASSDPARSTLDDTGPVHGVLAALAADPAAGGEVTAYLDAVRYRSVGYDVGDKMAGEMPELLLGALRAAVAGMSAAPESEAALEAVRSAVPAEHLADFDDRLAEAKLVNRLRDERGVYSDGWATGLARRALLEAGRRLESAGRLTAAAHAVDLEAVEVAALLRGQPGPSAEEAARRFVWRTTKTIDDVPPFLRARPAPPPPAGLLPKEARRGAVAVDTMIANLFGVAETPNTETVLHGLAVNTGSYEGTARLVDDAGDFGRIQQGDVLVTRMTSPYFNVVLPLLGAIVTDRGGQLSHAAIVAREYGIPGIVGTRDATGTIPDGARVRVDGATGEVRLLA